LPATPNASVIIASASGNDHRAIALRIADGGAQRELSDASDASSARALERTS
jgi:hypothetical protein